MPLKSTRSIDMAPPRSPVALISLWEITDMHGPFPGASLLASSTAHAPSCFLHLAGVRL